MRGFLRYRTSLLYRFLCVWKTHFGMYGPWPKLRFYQVRSQRRQGVRVIIDAGTAESNVVGESVEPTVACAPGLVVVVVVVASTRTAVVNSKTTPLNCCGRGPRGPPEDMIYLHPRILACVIWFSLLLSPATAGSARTYNYVPPLTWACRHAVIVSPRTIPFVRIINYTVARCLQAGVRGH